MGKDTVDARTQALGAYGLQVLENTNNADEELQDKGKAMMANYVEEVVRGQIELVREYTECAIDLESEPRSDDEDDSYLGTDDEGEDDEGVQLLFKRTPGGTSEWKSYSTARRRT